MVTKFLFLFLSIAALMSAAASDLDFTLVNKTNRSFEAVYINAANAKKWDSNLLPTGRVLTAGGKIHIKFNPDAKSATWDFNIVDDEGLSLLLDDVNLINAKTIALVTVNGKITAEVE